MAAVPLSLEFLDALRAVVGAAHVHTSGEIPEAYSHDYTEDFRFLPGAVVLPGAADEVAAVMRLCHAAGVPVTPAGARTGLSGGVLPVQGGISLGLARLNRIVEIDARNLQVTVEPGVITQALQDAVAAQGLYYPVDPASRGSCFIGGNLAESSGGMRAVKYGITRDYVLDLEVVLADGTTIRTGARTLKNSTGYNLTQLMVGSEGTLGIITQAVLRLVPLPQFQRLIVAGFPVAEQACDAVTAVFHAGVVPAAIEFMEREAVLYGQRYLQEQVLDHGEDNPQEAWLLVELDGNHAEALAQDAERVMTVLANAGAAEVLYAESAAEQERFWRLRRSIGVATKTWHVVKEEDTVVPRAELARLWRFIKDTAARHGFKTVCWGHAGDGNLHCNILRTTETEAQWREGLKPAIREIFAYTRSLGGTLSGEHGIGWVQREYMDVVKSAAELELLRGIKRVFDPKGILNPGKILPDA